LGQRQGNDVVITSGLAANERVVLAGQLLVRPGSKVQINAGSAASSVSNGNENTEGGKS
jgi:hypothetical protein